MSHLTFDRKDADGYDQVLNRVRQLAIALQGAIDGQNCGQPQLDRACLMDLHSRSRGIAAVLNQALGASYRAHDPQRSALPHE